MGKNLNAASVATKIPKIQIRKVAHEMESMRRACKSKWADKYEGRVAMFRSLIRKEMKARSTGAIEAALNFIGLLKARGKMTPILKAVIFSAALDVAEGV